MCALRWRYKPELIPDRVSHTENQWILIKNMDDIFNQNWKDYLYHQNIFVWTRCYGLGGVWINIVLPTYMASSTLSYTVLSTGRYMLPRFGGMWFCAVVMSWLWWFFLTYFIQPLISSIVVWNWFGKKTSQSWHYCIK